jgi:hypothetical protein
MCARLSKGDLLQTARDFKRLRPADETPEFAVWVKMLRVFMNRVVHHTPWGQDFIAELGFNPWTWTEARAA